jgi:dihydrodiol dehydrogenase / D-xylose 1-dehydrogenase (NADP)
LRKEGDGHREERLYEHPIPVDTEEITNGGGYFYPNSAGFAYEAAAVARCIGSGKTGAPQFPLSETLIKIKLIDDLHAQLGVKPLPLTAR